MHNKLTLEYQFFCIISADKICFLVDDICFSGKIYSIIKYFKTFVIFWENE